MTNYNERLGEVLTTCDFEPDGFNSRICLWCGERKGTKIHTAKQAFTSLIKELVAEAKPEEHKNYYTTDPVEGGRRMGYNEAVREFEQNLLKALEEV